MRPTSLPLRNLFLTPTILPRRRLSATPYRSSSTSSDSAESNPPSPHVQIYRTHGRAILKVLTMSFFFYQVSYWTWLTIENDELQAQKKKEVDILEGVVKQFANHKKGEGKRPLKE